MDEIKNVIKTFEPSGEVARVSMSYIQKEDIEGLRIWEAIYGKVEGLPEKKEGIFYIVSGLVKSALPERKDLLAPDTNRAIRENGKILGVQGFVN